MKLLRIANGFLFSLIFITIGIAIYLYFFRTIDIVKENPTFERVLVNDISDIEAEKLNYDNVKPKNRGSVLENIVYEEFLDLNESGSFKKLINLKKDGVIIQNEDLLKSNLYIPIIYSENYESYVATELFSNINKLVLDNPIKSIVVHYSLQNDLTEYYQLISLLDSIESLEILLMLNMRSADKVNYSIYKEYNPTQTKIIEIDKVKDLADKFLIVGYDYTPATSVLPGPNSKLFESEDVIQYYIAKGLDPSKTYLGVNRSSFLWSDRFFEVSIDSNIVLKEAQAKLFIEDNKSLYDVNTSSIMDSHGLFNIENKPNVVVFPSEEFLENLKDLALEYNLAGMFFRY